MGLYSMKSSTGCYLALLLTLILGNSCAMVVILRVVVQANLGQWVCFPGCWLEFFPDMQFSGLQGVKMKTQKGREEITSGGGASLQTEVDCRTSRPAIFLYRFIVLKY